MHTLIAFATQWGSKLGGINSFNADFLSAFGAAYGASAQVVCIVASATPDEVADARDAAVALVPLPDAASLPRHLATRDFVFQASHGTAGLAELRRRDIRFRPEATIWLGHDRVTGEAAVAAAKAAGGRSALIHHMSYAAYEAFAENARAPLEKELSQRALFRRADLAVAVGPLLREALHELLGSARPVHMLVPGLADIEVREAPQTFTAFFSGRLSDDAARIKQGHLGVAAFARAQHEARAAGMPASLCRQPKLVLRGVDFGRHAGAMAGPPPADTSADLARFAANYAQGEIDLHPLPYTQDRRQLYAELSGSSVALMPSWHEGFGLAAWEAIAAGVPLIVSRQSGVYRLLEHHHPQVGPACVHAVEVRGASAFPYFHPDDLRAVVGSLKKVADNPAGARRAAARLRAEMGGYTWAACVEQAAQAFQWPLIKRVGIHGAPLKPLPGALPGRLAAAPAQTPARQRGSGQPVPRRWSKAIG